jgi:hypothetical protein
MTASRPLSFAALVASFFFGLFPSPVSATHSWGSYHWSTPSLPLKLDLGDNLSGAWVTGNYLRDYVLPWNNGCAGDLNGTLDSCRGNQPSGESGTISSQVNLSIVSGGTDPRRCRPTAGRVEVCNYTYGNNGWLGIAQIWVSGGHIVQAVAKLNDTYFNTSTYNKTEWRGMVICQEVGHTFGLDHQDENFNNPNLGTCMDYTSNPAADPANTLPNYHDFEQLALIYNHTHDASTSGGTGGGKGKGKSSIPPATYEDLNDHAKWGVLRRESNDGRTALYERDLGQGYRLFTFVIRAK